MIGMDPFGTDVFISDALPIHPSHQEDARRIVRHGLADVLAWLGEEIGPEPGAATHAFVDGRRVYVSAEFMDMVRRKL